MGKQGENLRARRVDDSQLRVVKKQSVPGIHYAALRMRTLCGWPLKWLDGTTVELTLKTEVDCELCHAVIDVVCENFE